MSDDAEDKAARVRRAREVLDGADWLFRERAETLKNNWINTAASDSSKREEIYVHLQAVIHLKAILVEILDKAANDEALREHTRR